MVDANPTPTTPRSRRMSPLAIIIVVLVAVLAVVAFTQWRGTQHTGSGAPVAAKDKDAVMPDQATAPAAPQPASNQPWAKAGDSRPNSPNEEGGTEATAGGTANAAGAR